jgi:diguanylate cyclase (GGDEF)-like protein
MLIDLDSFKNVNDVHGHQAGDELLREFGRRLKHLVFDEDLVSRMGGDEFAIFLSSPQSVTHVEELSSRIIDAATAPFKIMGTESYVGASIGVFLPGDADMQPGEAMRRADTALYEAKRAGKARYSVYSMEMDASVAYRRKIERELSLALAGAGGLSCHYQPLVRSCDGAITGVEVLARWHHAEMGAIAPGQFIPVAEESGLIRQLGEWILRRACQELRQWHQLQVAVNISPIQVREPNFSEKILSLLEEEGFPPHRLELEITESAIASVDEAWIGQIKRLREKGMRIALDDFGTGYSSLRLLRDFDLDKVKIDRSFVQFVTEESESAAIVEALARIGKTLQLEVVAEGVETAEQRLFLVEAGCTALQGFLLGRPLDAASLESFLQASCPSTEHIKGAGC